MSDGRGLDLGRRALARNTVWNILGQGLPLGVALLAVPVLLRSLGEGRFGLLGLVWMFVTLFGELGFGRAGTRFLAEALGGGKSDHLRPVVRTTLRAQLVLGVLFAVLLGAVSGVLVGRVLSVDPGLVEEARTSFLWLAATVPLLTLGAAYRGFLEAAQRFGELNAVRFTVSTLNYLVPVAAVLLGGGVVTVVALLMAIRAGGTLAFWWRARRLWVSAPRPRAGADAPDARAILGFGTWVTVSSVVSPVLVYLDRFLLGALVSVAAVGVYTAPYEVVTRLLLVPAAVASTLFPAVSALRGRRRPGEVERVTRLASLTILVLVGPVVAVLVVFAGPLLDAWLGAGSSPAMVLALQLLAPGVLANSLAFVPYSLLQGMGRADLTGRLHLMELPIHAVLAYWLIGRYGVAGAAGAWSVRTTLDAVVLFALARRLGDHG